MSITTELRQARVAALQDASSLVMSPNPRAALASNSLEAKAEAAGALSSLSVGHAIEVGEAGAIVPLVALLQEDSLLAQLKGQRTMTYALNPN